MNNKLVFKIAKRTIILVLIIVAILALAFKDSKPLIMGLVFGTAISILNFKLLDNTISKALRMPPARATSFTIAHYIARYIIYFTVLLVAAKADYLNLIATIAGLIAVKFVILISNIVDKDFTKT